MDFGQAGATPVAFFTGYPCEGGEQRRRVGSQRFAPGDPTVSVDLIRTAGAQFGNAFRPGDLTQAPWGEATQRFVDCDTLEPTCEKGGGKRGTLTLERGPQRLGDGVRR